VQNVVFFGGAVDFKKNKKWGNIFQKMVAGKIHNFYSNNDEILKKLFPITSAKNKNTTPIGIMKLENCYCNKIFNTDVSNKINGHMSYSNFMDSIMEDIEFDK
jgi:hypothetical protein